MKRPATIHLMGGGRGGLFALRRALEAALGRLEGREAVIAYVGAASDDSGVFFTMVKACLHLRRSRMLLVRTASPRASASEARALLEGCDLVFLSGGDVDRGMAVLQDRDLVTVLQALARDGKSMLGVSAGSIMLARDWVHFSDDGAAGAELFPCLGVAPLHVDAHAEGDDWEELRVLVDLLRRRGEAEPVGYGLTRQGGLRVGLRQGAVDVEAIGTAIPRVGVVGGEVVDLAPLTP